MYRNHSKGRLILVFFDEYINKLDRSANFIGFKQTTKNGRNENKNKMETNKATKLKLHNKKEHETPNQLEEDEDLDEIKVVPDEGEDQTKKEQECKFWTDKGKCQFGEICHYKHSNKCQNIMTNGDCQDRNCKKKHPEVCYSMQQSGQCDRQNGKFVHKKISSSNIENIFVSNSFNFDTLVTIYK